MKIADIAIRQVPSVTPTQLLRDAIPLFEHTGACVIPVIAEGRLFGALCERDISRHCGKSGCDPARVTVADVCAQHPVACQVDTNLQSALQLMRKHRQSWLLLSDGQGGFAGLVTAMQLIGLILELVPEASEGPEPGFVRQIRGGAPPL
jgi:CBS domain-containing protein